MIGSSVATTGRPAAAASARASTPASEIAPRWSADSARSRPPARRRRRRAAHRRAAGPRRPSSLARSSTRRDCAGVEDTLLAEHVARRRDALLGDARQLLVDDALHVRVAAPSRPRNSAATACAPRNVGTISSGPSSPRSPASLQQAQLRLRVQPVARLDLDGRHAVAEHLGQPSLAPAEQELLVRAARVSSHRLQDAAARGEDLQVAVAALAQLDLVPGASRRRAGACADRSRPGVTEPPRASIALERASRRCPSRRSPPLDLGPRRAQTATIGPRQAATALSPPVEARPTSAWALPRRDPAGERGDLRRVVNSRSAAGHPAGDAATSPLRARSASASRSSSAIDGHEVPDPQPPAAPRDSLARSADVDVRTPM